MSLILMNKRKYNGQWKDVINFSENTFWKLWNLQYKHFFDDVTSCGLDDLFIKLLWKTSSTLTSIFIWTTDYLVEMINRCKLDYHWNSKSTGQRFHLSTELLKIEHPRSQAQTLYLSCLLKTIEDSREMSWTEWS